MRKVFGFKSITTLIYGLLMLLPMFSILSRVIYVQSNPNAMQSYSGNTEMTYFEKVNKYESNEISLNSDTDKYENILVGNLYYLEQFDYLAYVWGEQPEGSITIVSYIISAFDADYEYLDLQDNFGEDYTDFNEIDLFQDSIGFYIDNSEVNFILNSLKFTKVFLYLSDSSLIQGFENIFIENYATEFRGCTEEELSMFYEYEERTFISSNLDNVFDYSLKTFVDDNNYGFNFFSWFGDMFLEQNGNNMIYLNFINWYLNYGLLISVAYIFFLILLWFINLSRRILDRLMNFDGGGY